MRAKNIQCVAIGLLLTMAMGAAAQFATVEAISTPAGYLARLLINEAAFPGERGYVSEMDTKAAMLSILWVLHSHVPTGYSQKQICAVNSDDILEVITAPNQCEGFFRNADGQPDVEPRVTVRLANLLRIANGGEAPGRFAGLLNFAQGLANAYLAGGIPGADRYAGLTVVNRLAVTGRAYAWMTDQDFYDPGGNFVMIPDSLHGALGGNRFFTLRKEPR